MSKWNALSEDRRQYLAGALFCITSLIGAKLTDAESKYWMMQLDAYPNWKLIKLDEFRPERGRALVDVLKFLDELMPMPEREPVREDLGYKKLEHKPDKEIGRRTLAHCKAIMDENKTSEERDAMEREFIISMRRDFPHINWKSARKANANI